MEHIDSGRRSFFNWSFRALAFLGLGGVLYSMGGFLGKRNIEIVPLADRRSDKNAPVMSSDGNSIEIAAQAVPDGTGLILSMGTTPVILLRNSDQWRAFNATCTHLGCLVKWEQAEQRFFCPCHGGVYDRDGRVVAGPPPGPLREHHVALEGDTVRVTRA